MNPAPTGAEAQRALGLAEEANQLVQQAKKSLESTSGFWSFAVDKSDKQRNAVALYKSAAKAYVEAKQYEEAGKALDAAVEIRENQIKKERDQEDIVISSKEVAYLRVDAFNAYKNTNFEAAMRCMGLALEGFRRFGDASSFARAASVAAEALENHDDRKGAMALYGEMGRRYQESGKFESNAATQYEKEAELAALEGDYFKAVESYEKAADLRLPSISSSTAKKNWFKAGLCALATKDLVTVQRNLQTYLGKDPLWERDRDYQLLSDLMEAIGAGDQQAFTQKVFAYDQMSKFKPWETAILVKIKNGIEEADNEFA
ncbi:soluble NSF attachment protein [Staphylotrichum tortipilum]|uniref:Soluble NSF attachment protein n=1 Tax=Staphylotrichum tortipilum TaxID=2831512 RepID=A0AAN6RX08_9PEZI|nr:soluble NSF attachment protein [Staphylotrichum longicolle]